MNIRQARKIMERHTGWDERPYRESTLARARRVLDRLKSTKANEQWWDRMMRAIGPVGRAQSLARQGLTGAAFNLLMKET